ncbi:MAG: DUF3109 family protein [Bacteroidota bacterium]|nr:DUF3109 family protein [Bacteroidota bacterium]
MNKKIFAERSNAEINFVCDFAQCKGACCTMKGARGAPLADDEIDEMYKAFPAVKKYLSKEHLAVIGKNGMIQGDKGNYATQCVHEEACVFVYFENGIAKCSFEKAFLNGESKWRKPLSCHLFPFRQSSNGNRKVFFEYIRECEPALKRGTREKIPVYKFLKEALVRAYGEQPYKELSQELEHGVDSV